jgi:hypothetical protein
MMENKETFVMFKSNIDVIKELPTDAEKLEMLYAIADYSMTGIIPEFKSLTCKLIFMSIRPNIDGANKRYTASVENGKKGGAPKGTTPWNKGKKKSEPKANPSEPSSNQLEPNANLYVSVSVSTCVCFAFVMRLLCVWYLCFSHREDAALIPARCLLFDISLNSSAWAFNRFEMSHF